MEINGPLVKSMDGLFNKRVRMAFNGIFHCKVDSKGRLKLPVALKQQGSSATKTFVLTNNYNGAELYLDLIPSKEWKKLEKSIQSLPQLTQSVQTFQRFYLAAGQEVIMDQQQRLSLPQSLRKQANIESEVVVVGMGSKIEIWSKSAWNKIYKSMQQQFVAAVEDVSQMLGED